ncbi:MAG: NAD(P)H-dependent oxidoreductase [Verrucomicrobia bacterium]|nr:NAD(P)H-dependent oxidoreductase [Verrucomicrobiota bacterium]
MPACLVISTSGNPDSNSRRMAQYALNVLKRSSLRCDWLDISRLDLPLCDADVCYGHAGAQQVSNAIEAADGIIVATPIYNYDVSAAAKNMVELTGSAWEEKIVAFLCAAGGMSSYMSVMSFANSLMFDFRSIIIPRFVYATGSAFKGDELVDHKVGERIEQLTAEMIRFVNALRGKQK